MLLLISFHYTNYVPLQVTFMQLTSWKTDYLPSSTHMFVKELFAAVIFRSDEHQKSQPPVIVSPDFPTITLLLITIYPDWKASTNCKMAVKTR